MYVEGLRMSERFFLYDDIVTTKTRFVSFMGENSRFDLATIFNQTDIMENKSYLIFRGGVLPLLATMI